VATNRPHKLSKRPKKANLLLYAHPGTGKTILASSGAKVDKRGRPEPDHIRTLLLNADGPDGPESARARGFDPLVWDIEGYDDLDRVLKHRHKVAELVGPGGIVWLDSSTLFQELGMDDVMTAMLEKRPDRDPDVPDMPEYLRNQNKFGKWVRHMKAQPFNFGITAHVMRIEDEDGEVTYMPAIQGGGKIPLSSKICGYMSIVGRLYVVERKKEKGGKPVRVLQTAPRGKYYAKDRFDALGERVIEPSLPKIMSMINGRKR